MNSKRNLLKNRSNLRERVTPPRAWARAANSAKSKASELVKTVCSKLESPNLTRRGRLPDRRPESVDRSNSNLNNTDPNSYETSSMQTTSTSSSAHSGFLSFALPTTVNPNDPLPMPTCRLGVYQAEWLVGTEGVWKLITENATAAPVEQVDTSTDHPRTLKRINRSLKKEQEFLRAKLSILYAELAKKTAIVHHYDEQLEKLRQRVKQELGETPESVRSSIRKEMEEQRDRIRMEQAKTGDLTSDSDLTPNAEVSPTKSVNTNKEKKDTHDLQNTETIQIPRHSEAKLGRRGSDKHHAKETDPSSQSLQAADLRPTGDDASELHSRESDSKISYGMSAKSKSEGSPDDTVRANNNDLDSDNTETGEETMDDELEEESEEEENEQEAENEESENDEESEEGEEEEEDEEQYTEDNEDEEEEDEEELPDTEESQSDPHFTPRHRIVQFGKVSRR